MSESAQREWDVLVRRAVAIRESSREVPCSSEAREIFRSFHNEAVRLRNEQFRSIEGELGRWRENAIRVAGGHCIADALVGGDLDSILLISGHAQLVWPLLAGPIIIQSSCSIAAWPNDNGNA